MLSKTFTAIDIFSLGTCDGKELVSTDLDADGKFEFLFLGASLWYIDVIEVGGTEGTEVCISCGRIIGITLGKYDGTELGL